MMQRRCRGDRVNAGFGITGHSNGINKQHERARRQRRVENILTQTAAERLYCDNRKYAARCRQPERHRYRQSHAKQHACHDGGAVCDGIACAGHKAVQKFGAHSTDHAQRDHEKRPESVLTYAHRQCRYKRGDHVKHDAARSEIASDMR